MRRIALAVVLFLFSLAASADEFNTVIVGGSTPATTTITTTNTFQNIINASNPNTGAPLHGCAVQDKGANFMYVFPGTATAANINSSGALQIQPPSTTLQGGVFYCQDQNGHIMSNAFSITGTSGDAYSVWTW
jgi:hypothetical protein